MGPRLRSPPPLNAQFASTVGSEIQMKSVNQVLYEVSFSGCGIVISKTAFRQQLRQLLPQRFDGVTWPLKRETVQPEPRWQFRVGLKRFQVPGLGLSQLRRLSFYRHSV